MHTYTITNFPDMYMTQTMKTNFPDVLNDEEESLQQFMEIIDNGRGMTSETLQPPVAFSEVPTTSREMRYTEAGRTGAAPI